MKGTNTTPPGRLSASDLHRLRQAHLKAREAGLRAELSQHQVAALTLELEWRYRLLGIDAAINVHTGAITIDTPLAGNGVNHDHQ